MNSVILTSNSAKEQVCLKDLKLCIRENRTLDEFEEFLDDKFLLHFVRGKKCDSKKAYVALQNYINVRRTKYKEMFKSLRPSTNTAMDTKSLRILKNRDSTSSLVAVIRINCWNPRLIPTREFTNMSVLGVEEMWNFRDAEDNGIVLIFDMAGYSLHHATAITIPEFIKHVSLLWQNYPLRPRAIHVVNEIYMCNLFLRAVKPLLTKKIRERLNLHSFNLDSLHKHVSPEILPEFLGGKLSGEDAFDLTFEKRIMDKEHHYQRFAEVLK